MHDSSTTNLTGSIRIPSCFIDHPLILLATIGMVLRMVLMVLFTYVPDVGSWGLTVENYHAGLGLYDVDGYFYPPVWGYVLAFDTWFMDSFLDIGYVVGIPDPSYPEVEMHVAGRIPSLAFSVFVKIVPVFTDLALAYAVYLLIGRFTEERRKQILGFAAVMLMPIIMTVSSIGGMFDNMAALFLILSLLFLCTSRYEMSGVALAVAGMTKFYPFFAIVPMMAYIFSSEEDRRKRTESLVRMLVSFIITILVLLLPQILSGDVESVFHFITYRLYDNGNSDEMTDKGMMVLAVFAAGAALFSLISVWIFRKTQNRDRTLVFTVTLCIMALIVASYHPQYFIEVAPLIIVCWFVYGLPVGIPVILINLLYILKLFLKMPVILYPLAHDTDMMSLDTIGNFTETLTGDGPMHTLYSFAMSYSNKLQIVLVILLCLLSFIYLMKGSRSREGSY